MCSQMFIEIAQLRKALGTVFNWTNKWSFFGMDSQVIKQIMPFSKYFSALSMVADENLGPSTCLLIIIFDQSELFTLWDYHLSLEFLQI